MIEFLSQPWPWYVSGAVIALVMMILLFWGKSFGFSSNLRTICTACGAGKKVKFFDFDWRTQQWNLLFLAGAVVGGIISSVWLQSPEGMHISEATISDLKALGINFHGQLNPDELFTFGNFDNPLKSIALLLGGGFLVGFGSRYAGGCTSGHAISGLSNLQIPSLIAVVGFFIGGLLMTHFLLPYLL
jgi:uncharacterized membrane protein YedE/YeeE